MTPLAAWRKTGATKHTEPSGNRKDIDAALMRCKLAGVLILNGTMPMSPQHRTGHRYELTDRFDKCRRLLLWEVHAV